jgi:hypothetical protein
MGIAESVRYGSRKDITLEDVWDALCNLSDRPFSDYPGLTIQLLDWAALLHDLTDGKSTKHVEGEILLQVLREKPDLLAEAERLATHWMTRDAILDFKIEALAPGDWPGHDALYNRLAGRQDNWTDAHKFLALAKHASAGGDGPRLQRAMRRIVAKDPNSNLSYSDRQSARRLARGVGIEFPAERDKPTRRETESVAGLAPNATRRQLAAISTSALASSLNRITMTNWSGNRRVALKALRVLADRDPSLARRVTRRFLAETQAIAQYFTHGFADLAAILLDVNREMATRDVLRAWRDSSIVGKPYGYGVLPSLVLVTKQGQGLLEAQNLVDEGVRWLEDLFRGHRHRIQRWGALQSA